MKSNNKSWNFFLNENNYLLFVRITVNRLSGLIDYTNNLLAFNKVNLRICTFCLEVYVDLGIFIYFFY